MHRRPQNLREREADDPRQSRHIHTAFFHAVGAPAETSRRQIQMTPAPVVRPSSGPETNEV